VGGRRSQYVLTVSHSSFPWYAGAERVTPPATLDAEAEGLGAMCRIEASPANSDKSRLATRRLVFLGYTVNGLSWTSLSEICGDLCSRCR